jgi:hypothetical protein
MPTAVFHIHPILLRNVSFLIPEYTARTSYGMSNNLIPKFGLYGILASSSYICGWFKVRNDLILYKKNIHAEIAKHSLLFKIYFHYTEIFPTVLASY